MSGERVYLDVNWKGEEPHVLVLVIERPTGVVYGNQTDGLATGWRNQEGYLAVLGTGAETSLYIDFFRRFQQRPPRSGEDWTEKDLAELADLLARTARHVTTDADGNDEAQVFAVLDESRLADLTEGWIPVVVGDERGILMFPNSD